MKSLQVSIIFLLGSLFFASGVAAQNKPLACQSDAAAGLKWENGRWVTKSFEQSKFILVQASNTLTIDSVGKALTATPSGVSCRNDFTEIHCTDNSGGGLYFDSRSLKGGISQLFGSINEGVKRDTVTVQIFSCTPF